MNDAATRKTIERDRASRTAATELVVDEARACARFHSILFGRPEDRKSADAIEPPTFFADLNCDQLVDGLTAGKEEYGLRPFYHSPLHRIDAIRYRQEIFQDLENPSLLAHVNSFARKMHEMREHLVRTEKLHCKEQRQAFFLEAVEAYCQTSRAFAKALRGTELKSRGFSGFRDYLTDYVASARFQALFSQTEKLKADLASVRYTVLIKAGGFTVRRYESESDYGRDVEQTFAKFKQGAVRDYRVAFSANDDMNHVEAKILEFVARLYPEVFVPLDEYCLRNVTYLDETLAAFDREIQFYVAYLEYCAPLQRAGLKFCYPDVSDETKEVCGYDGFDIALADKLVKEGTTVVCNDFYMKGAERILVVSGPNQGGKTTFARSFGQMHYLASLGCPVPGIRARLFLFDELFTHFERVEKVENRRGKLEDDLIRIHHIISRTTARSVIILNEVFTSATLHDEIKLSTKIMEKLVRLDPLCVWVTFVDELASFGPQTVSMVSTVVPENPALRTFKIVRRPADGLAYATAIARKYRLTYAAIRERINS